MTTVKGRAGACKAYEGRGNLIVIEVFTGTAEGSGSYNCDPANVTLNGVPPVTLGNITDFVTGHQRVNAVVTDPDRDSTVADGENLIIPCAAIDLTALE